MISIGVYPIANKYQHIAPQEVPIRVVILFNKKLSVAYCNAPKVTIPFTELPEITNVSKSAEFFIDSSSKTGFISSTSCFKESI